jgi:hypothetical protein
MWVVNTTPRQFYPLERSITYCTVRWVHLGISMYRTKISPPLGFGSRSVQPLSNLCTDYAIAATSMCSTSSLKRPCLCYIFFHINRKLGKQAISKSLLSHSKENILYIVASRVQFFTTPQILCAWAMLQAYWLPRP